METLSDFTEAARSGRVLSTDQARSAASRLADEAVDGETKGAFLAALAQRGEAASEVAAFAAVFREMARDPGLGDIAARAIDIVGTGGDGSGTFNISTTAALIVAAGGVPVLKHGNRSITSKSGSADLLEAVGIRLDADLALIRKSVEELNFCFFFAPAYHPAFKSIMPVRKALAEKGQRTVFNILGPLINPARPAHELMGVFSEDWVSPAAEALHELGLTAALAVHCRLPADSGARGMDELSTAGSNVVAGSGRLREADFDLSTEALGLRPAPFAELKGGTPAENRRIFSELLAGRGPRGLIDTICLNAGAAFLVAGAVDSVGDGITRARRILLDGVLRRWVERIPAVYGQ